MILHIHEKISINTGPTTYNKMALELIKNASNEINKVAKRRIQQAIT